MKRTLTYTIENETTVLDFLKRHGYSHSVITHLKRTPYSILGNGKWLYVNDRLMPGDILTIHLIEEESSAKILPVPMDLDIVYEDEDILVLNKPADMPIHPSLNNYENTLANGVADYYQQKGEAYVFRCMNRLDRGHYRSYDPRKTYVKCCHFITGCCESCRPSYLSCHCRRNFDRERYDRCPDRKGK